MAQQVDWQLMFQETSRRPGDMTSLRLREQLSCCAERSDTAGVLAIGRSLPRKAAWRTPRPTWEQPSGDVLPRLQGPRGVITTSSLEAQALGGFSSGASPSSPPGASVARPRSTLPGCGLRRPRRRSAESSVSRRPGIACFCSVVIACNGDSHTAVCEPATPSAADFTGELLNFTECRGSPCPLNRCHTESAFHADAT
jgi:hypothetical protein